MVQTYSTSHSHNVPTDPSIATGDAAVAATAAQAIATGDAAVAATAAQEVAANKGLIDLLTARVVKLEAAAAPPPVVTPPVTPPPPVVGTRPWALPVTSRTVPILPSIDATGKTDVTAVLNAFIAGVPDGSVITSISGKTYKIGSAILLAGRNNLIFDFAGSTINNVANAAAGVGTGVGGASSYQASTFWWSWADKPPTHITIKNLLVKAANPNPGAATAVVGGEYAAVLHAMGGQYIELDTVTGQGLYGDLLTINENALYVWAHNVHAIDASRNGVSVVCGSHVLIEDSAFDTCGYCIFDVEPEVGSIAGSVDLIFRRNASKVWRNCYFALDGSDSGKVITDVTLDSNHHAGAGLWTVAGFSGPSSARPARIAFTNNASDGSSSNPIEFNHIDGLTVKGNTEAGRAKTPTITDCTGVA